MTAFLSAPSSLGLTWSLLVLALALPTSVVAQSKQPKTVKWQGIETFEDAYTYSGRISAHLGNVNEYNHKITVRFTYIEETDAQGARKFTSRKIRWTAEGKAVATGFTSTTCSGSGSLELVGLSDGDINEKLKVPCTTKSKGILVADFISPRVSISPPKLVDREKLRNNCSYSEERIAPSGERYSYSVWVSPGCKCDPSIYQDYLRKQQASRELFQHSQDLRRQADQALADHLRDEARRLGGEVAADIGFDQAIETGTAVGKRYLNGQRSALATKAAALAPAASVGMSVGGLIPLAETAYRGHDVVGRINDWNDQAKNAAAEAARLWQSALADFKADLMQAEACLEESRKAAAEEQRLEEAKALIEEWENNQVLYRDPISQDALVEEAAIKRALEHLGYSRRQSLLTPGLQRVAFVRTADSYQVTVNAQQLAAAIREMDIAIVSFSRRSSLRLRAIQAQKVIDEKLAAIMLSSARETRLRLIPRSPAPTKAKKWFRLFEQHPPINK